MEHTDENNHLLLCGTKDQLNQAVDNIKEFCVKEQKKIHDETPFLMRYVNINKSFVSLVVKFY